MSLRKFIPVFFLFTLILIAFLLSPITVKTAEAHSIYCGIPPEPFYPLDSNTIAPPIVNTTVNGQQITVSWTATTGCYAWYEQPTTSALRLDLWHWTTATSATFTGSCGLTYQPTVGAVNNIGVTFWGYCCNIGHPPGWNHTFSRNVTVSSNIVTPSCPPPFDYNLTNNGNITASQGGAGSNVITANLTVAPTQAVSFSASGLPAGATPSFSPTSCNPTCSSTLTISTTTSTPLGTYFITVTGSPLNRTTSFNLIINNPLPDLIPQSLGFTPTNAIEGTDVTFNATIRNQGTVGAEASATSFSLDVNSDGATTPDPPPWRVDTEALAAGATSALLSTSPPWTAVAGIPLGRVHTLTICTDMDGIIIESNEMNNCAPISFIIYPLLTASCSVSPASTTTGTSVTWTAFPSGGTGSYTYSWSGTDGLSGSTNPISRSYSTAGTKTASVTVTSGSQNTGPVSCSNSVTVTAPLPWIQTTGGDVHSDTRINTPGGP